MVVAINDNIKNHFLCIAFLFAGQSHRENLVSVAFGVG
jgi:hypothetical protein